MKRLKSLSLKNFLTTAIILLMSFLLTGVAFSFTLYRSIYQENRKNMISALGQASRMITAYAAQWKLEDLEVRFAVSSVASLSGNDVLIADKEGVVVSCSDRELNCPHLGKRIPSEVLARIPAADSREDGQISTRAVSGAADFDGLYENRRHYAATALLDIQSGEEIGYLLLSKDLRSHRELWQSYSTLFVFVAAVVFVFAAVITSLATRHQTRPLGEMAAVTNRFGRGELDARVTDTGRRDEIGTLQRSFNAMADTLESTERKRRELVANVSHDLKTPITTISGFADGILDGTIPPEREREYLATISSEAKRMNRMVQNMLALSRMEAVDPAEILRGSFDICEVARLCLIGLEHRIDEKNLDVDLKLPEEEMIVRGDADAITRVVTNLLDNAVKFAEAGSTLGLEIWKQGGKAYISVQDRGEPIPPQELPRIFERFHKGDSSRNLDKSGSGLGLFIVKSILDSHREDIYVSSEEGVTRFVFTLSLR